MTVTSCRKIVTSLSFFRFMTNLGQSGSQIPNAESVNFKTATLILQKLKTELKNRSHCSHTITLSKGTIFVKKC